MTDTLEVNVLRNWNEIEQLKDDWICLQRESDCTAFFLSWDWISVWRESSVGTIEPFVFVASDASGNVRGIAPFYRSTVRLFGLLPLRVLRILGDVNSGAEYPDWLTMSADRASVLHAIAHGITKFRADWDFAWMPKVADGHGEEIVKACRGVSANFSSRETSFSGMELPDSISDFESGFSRNARSRIRRTTRNVLRIPEVEFAVCESQTDLPIFLNALFELHDARWSAAGKEGLFSRVPEERKFYESFAPRALKKGWLRLYGLRCGESFKAVQIGYQSQDTFLQMQEGFDPEFEAGAGNALRHLVIQNLISRGVKYYDFLGGISEHKRRWGAEPSLGADLLIGSGSLRSRVVLSGPFWPTGRFITS